METKLLKMLAQVAGIGGISLGVLLLVFREIIRKNIFPKFKDEKLAYSLLRMMIILVFSVAVIGIVAWVYTTVSERKIAETINVTSNEFSGEMHFVNINVILSQNEKAEAKSLSADQMKEIKRGINLVKSGFYDKAIPIFKKMAEQSQIPALYNNLGVLYAVTGNINASRESYIKAVEQDPDDKDVRLNLGLLEEKEGHIEKAVKHYEKASDTSHAEKAIKKIKEKRKAGIAEIEPNNKILEPNEISLDKWIHGSIASDADGDYFTFTTPETYRDIIEILIENLSATLRPALYIYDASKHNFWGNNGGSATPGQNLGHSFVSAPRSVYYIGVGGYHSAGAYQLKVTPLRAYDRYEPNNDIRHARSIPIGEPIKAKIMDKGDSDYYRIKTSTNKVTVNIMIENLSATLRPALYIYDASKHNFWGNNGGSATRGQNLGHSFVSESGSVYYIGVGGYHSAGAYMLRVSAKSK